MSSRTVIRVERLSKKYVLGSGNGGTSGEGMRHALQKALSCPWRGLQKWMPSAADPSGPAAGPGEFHALRDVSFDVQQGDVLGIIGRNGAGKSTLLKILSRITEPTSGRIGIKGRVASLLEVGTGFHPELTGRENIFLNGAILGMSRAEVREKLDAIIEFSGVEKFIDTPVKRYSSGMYVRLAFAVAAHLEPEILIVDEVLAVGDAEFQRKCLGKMRGIAGQGRTILFVSHNLQAVQSLCHTALHLKAGRVVDSGPALAVASRYLAETGAPEHGIAHVTSASFRLEESNVRYEEVTDGQARITIELRWASLEPFEGLHVDVAVENADETRVLQLMPRLYQPAVAMDSAGHVNLTYAVTVPLLRPGPCSLTIYAHLESGAVLTHISSIPAFIVAGTFRRPESLQSGFSGVIMPAFTLDAETTKNTTPVCSHAS